MFLFNDELARRTGKILIASLFLVSAGISTIGFNDFLGLITSKNLPFPFVLAIAALTCKFVGGFLLASGFLEKPGAFMLMIFTIITTILFHNPTDPAQLNNFLKNLAVIGALLIILSLNSPTDNFTNYQQNNPISL